MAGDIDLIWGSGKQKYFCKRGWTGKPPPPALICPSGKSRLHPWSCEGRVLIDFARYESPLCDCRQQRTFANSRLLIIERKKENRLAAVSPKSDQVLWSGGERSSLPLPTSGRAAGAAHKEVLSMAGAQNSTPPTKQRIMYFHPGTATGGDYVDQKSIFGLLFGNVCIRQRGTRD